jgi:hypothetical protein
MQQPARMSGLTDMTVRAADLFAVQSEIADKVTNTLGSYRGQLERAITAAAKRKRPANLGAYELYLLGIEERLSRKRGEPS